MLLVVSLGAGGGAQMGWNLLTSSSQDLIVSSPGQDGTHPSTQNARRAAFPPSRKTTDKPTATPPGLRASRDSTRAGSPAPSAKPVPSGSTRSATRRAPRVSDPPSSSVSSRAVMENQAVALTNLERGKHGCGPLRLESRLREAARGHSADMKSRGYFDHDTPEGVDPWERARDEGYAKPSGENIARGQETAQAVVQAWMKSPGHRANILNCQFKAIGVGVATGRGGPWWTQMFGFV